MKKAFTLLLLFSFYSQQTHAQDLTSGLSLSKDMGMNKAASGSEFISGDYPGAVLMKLNLWGAVGKSGIHYVPAQTDLITLLSYAGGPLERAKLDEVMIKRWTKGKERLIKINADEIIHHVGLASPILQANDVIVIPSKAPLVSQDVSAMIGLISSLLSIAAIGFVVIKR